MPGELMLVNPRRRKKPTRRAKKNPVRKKRRTVAKRSARRNPVRTYKRNRRRTRRGGIVNDTLIPAGIGGLGALAVDVAFGAIPFIPAQVKTGPMASIAKIGAGILLGMVARRAFGRARGNMVMLGAVTVPAYNLAKFGAQKAMPTIPLGEHPTLEFVNAAQFQADPLISGYVPDYETRQSPGMAEYIDGMATHNSGVGMYVEGYDGSYYE